MDMVFLRNFLCVVERGSMSEAARQLDLSPAAVAQQMRRLERDLGMPLLVRTGRTVQPTPAGHRLYEKGRALVHDWDALREAVARDEDRGALHMGTISTALHSFLPAVLQAFVPLHPDVQVGIRSGLSADLYAAVAQGDIDVALCLHPPFELSKALRWAPLREERLVLLASRALAGQDPLALLAREPLVRYDRTLGGGKLAEQYLRAQNLQPQERFELNSLLAVAMMVERGLGVALVPDIGAALVRGRALVKIELPQGRAARQLGMLWQRATPRARWIDSLVGCARQVVAQQER